MMNMDGDSPRHSSPSSDTSGEVRSMLLQEPPPPPIKRKTGRMILLGAVALTIAALLLLVVYNLDTHTSRSNVTKAPANVTELVPPTKLNQKDIDAGVSDVTRNT